MSFLYVKVLLVLLFLVSNKTFSQLEVLENDEELYYEVSYSFINIGWVKFTTKKKDGSPDVYICNAVMKSNDALPFITVNYEFTSELITKDNNIFPVYFTSKEFKGNQTSILTYDFNYDSSFVNLKKIGFNNEIEYEKKMPLHSVYQDGLSIFYYARFNSFKNGSRNVPVLIHQDSSSLNINFNTAKKEIEIDEVDYPLSSVYVDGMSYFSAVFGLTGEFSGWFSNDKARIPLKSKLRVKIGNVTLELKDWKRKNWSPPKY
ncbi:MAG: DUF3108 domain-containing protein [Ignavibacteria bacterium]